MSRLTKWGKRMMIENMYENLTKSLQALQDLRYDVSISQDINYKEANKKCDIIEKDLEVLKIFKKYCAYDGWHNGLHLKAWEMNEKELTKIREWFENE